MHSQHTRAWRWLMLMSLICTMLLTITGVSAEAFEDSAFQDVWRRTDWLVQQGQVSRTWLWGPEAASSRAEAYAESPGGLRLVQYFDKSRMEINTPAATRNG